MHRVIDHSETVRYAATCLDEAAATTGPRPDHVHFKCTACQHIYCLSQVPVPAGALPGPRTKWCATTTCCLGYARSARPLFRHQRR